VKATREAWSNVHGERDMLVGSRPLPHPPEVSMRNSKSKGPATQPPPPGGRAFERAKQFALARGLPLQISPETTPSTEAARSSPKSAPKRVKRRSAKPSTKSRSK